MSIWFQSEVTVLKWGNLQNLLHVPLRLKACVLHINLFVYVWSNV